MKDNSARQRFGTLHPLLSKPAAREIRSSRGRWTQKLLAPPPLPPHRSSELPPSSPKQLLRPWTSESTRCCDSLAAQRDRPTVPSRSTSAPLISAPSRSDVCPDSAVKLCAQATHPRLGAVDHISCHPVGDSSSLEDAAELVRRGPTGGRKLLFCFPQECANKHFSLLLLSIFLHRLCCARAASGPPHRRRSDNRIDNKRDFRERFCSPPTNRCP
jgi:hypothetical protein